MRQNVVDEVVGAILQVLMEGLPQNEAAVGFLETTWGASGREAVEALLADRESSESAGAAELLLYPDEEVEIRLEPVLEQARCTEDETRAVVRGVMAAVRRTEAVFPDGTRVEVTLGEDDAERFVRRLRPEHTPPPALAAHLDDRWDHTAGIRLKVRLRHCRLAWTQPRLRFMEAVLERLTAPEELALEVVDAAVALLDANGPAEDPVPALGRRFRELHAQLRRAEQQREAFAGSSMEVLAMRGVRLPHLDPDRVRHEIFLLDLIHRTVTGRPAAAADGVDELDLGGFDRPEDLVDALARFGREG